MINKNMVDRESESDSDQALLMVTHIGRPSCPIMACLLWLQFFGCLHFQGCLQVVFFLQVVSISGGFLIVQVVFPIKSGFIIGLMLDFYVVLIFWVVFNLLAQIFYPTFFLTTIFGPIIFWTNNFFDKQFFGPKFLLELNLFWYTHFF